MFNGNLISYRTTANRTYYQREDNTNNLAPNTVK